ncbi:RcnB family protein [Collimonas sp.]|uniref:RcnB family protein n=1 Tax=Collimonas sp. TaxID=1963772 RepID=UPI002C784682|nr:RcnB family protein [Collimonas sp.]HWX03276.1 RcnB family protein [Collimonas sp.]
MEKKTAAKTVASAIMAMSLITGSLAFGQGLDRPVPGYDQQHRDDRPDRRDDQDHRDDRGRQPDRGNHNDQRRDERGAGPDHAFYRGQRLPPEYRDRQYVVDDWRGHHLSAPPRGYHWVQTGGDYVLVAISTGIILQMLLGN